MNVEETEVMRMLIHPSPVKNMIDQKQAENMDYLNSFGSTMTNDARCTWEIKSRITTAKQHSPRRKLFLQVKLDLNLRKKVLKGYILSIALYIAETLTPREVDHKYLESSEMWCSRRMEKMQLDRSCEKRRSITQRQGGKEYPTNNREKEGQLDWSNLAMELSFTTRYRRKERCDEKTRKKT